MSVVLLLESDVAVLGLTAVRKANLRSKNCVWDHGCKCEISKIRWSVAMKSPPLILNF